MIYDFLSDDHKQQDEMCVVMDNRATLEEANAMSEFFCDAIKREYLGSVRFGFSFGGARARVILTGPQDAVQQLLDAYHNAE